MHSLSHSHSFLRPLASFPSSSAHRTSYLTLHSSSSSFISSAIYRTHAPSTTPNKLRGKRVIPSDSYNGSHWECQLSPPHRADVAPSEIDTDDGSSKGHLKFLLLFGFLALGDSYPAFAASDSFPFFHDFGDLSTGFASAFLLIFFSELGDKTFFIAALLAARNSGVVVFIGTFGALAAMTLISVVLGRTFHYVDEILPFRFGETDLPVDDIAAVCLLLYFGVSTLVDASSSDGQKSDDEQKEAELAVSEFSGNGAGILAAAGTVVSTFLLVFVAEWGDKSFFSTIACCTWGLSTRDIFVREGYFLHWRCSLSRLCCSDPI
ncbi:protein PAM71, chloroplastic isoform X2 [Arachis hypogaea]|uniref:protein PAM71, chloroplastic isoform X2 n=1 Tax=Arachis hypogaea TaxID=3818 RepID=UPI000DEC1844|nr:protein PAM71, chloroplastic isoform X2 [Arachis hypogaea]